MRSAAKRTWCCPPDSKGPDFAAAKPAASETSIRWRADRLAKLWWALSNCSALCSTWWNRLASLNLLYGVLHQSAELFRALLGGRIAAPSALIFKLALIILTA